MKLGEIIELRYGENGYQTAQFVPDIERAPDEDPLSIENFELVQGGMPGYNNITDLDRSLQTITHIAANFDRNEGVVPEIAVGVKHGNPCGAAYGENPIEAIRKMLDGNPISIFGGAIILNMALDEEIASEIIHHNMDEGKKRFIDTIIAPSLDEGAKPYLQRKSDEVRVLVNPALSDLSETSLDTDVRDRYVRGGHLIQDNYRDVLDFSSPDLTGNDGPELTDEQKRWLMLGWAVCATSNSNTITLVKDAMLIGNGAGQQDRVGAAKLAVKNAQVSGHDLGGCLACSDSFFPFPDGPLSLIEAGAVGILATEGSVKFEEVKAAIIEQGVAFYTRPDRSGRAFYGH